MSTNTTGSKLPTHKNLKDRIAAFQRLNQQSNSPSTSPTLSPTSPSPEPPLTATHTGNNANNYTKASLRDKIARFEAAGGTPIPRGSFGMGAISYQEDDISRRKGEMLGNRVPGLNRPTALPTEGMGMASVSHLTVKPIARDSTHHHRRGESQSLGSNHRRFASYSTLTSPSLSAYDGEGGAGLLDVDEFGGLAGLDRPRTPNSHYSPLLTPPSLPPPEVATLDKLPLRALIPEKFQRRAVSDYQASYGPTRASTPDPETPLQRLEEEIPLPSVDADSCSQPEPESIPTPEAHGEPKEPEVHPPAEPTLETQIPIPDGYSPASPDSSQEITMGTVSEPISEPVLVVDVIEEGVSEDDQRSVEVDISAQCQDRGSVGEPSIPIHFSAPSSPITDTSPPASSKVSAPPTLTLVTDTLRIAEEDGQTTSEPADELSPSPEIPRGSSDPPRPEDTPVPPTLAFPLPPFNVSSIEVTSESRTPPESPRPASPASTTASDLSNSGINYQSGSSHRDPDDDLFVLPLPKDDELPPRPIVKDVAVPRPMHRVFAAPLPTLLEPIEFPIKTAGSTSTQSSDLNTSFTGDESLALDASQAEIVIAQSEVIRPASRTRFIAMPSPSPTTTSFRMQTPPLSEESPLLPAEQVDGTQASPPRIRKKLYTNNTAPTSFEDTLSPPPTQQSFSVVVHQRSRTPTNVPDRVDSLTPRPSKPANTFMTPKKQSLFTEPMNPASPGSELAFLVKNAAILEAQLENGGGSGNDGSGKPRQSAHLSAEPSRSALKSGMSKIKSASTPTLVPSSVTNTGHIPPVPDLVYDDGSSNSGWSFAPQIPPFLPQFRPRKSGAHEEADRKSLAPSHKSRKSEKSVKEKVKDSIPRARKLSSRLRSLASSSTNSLKSLGRPSVSSETSVSFDGTATVSIEPMTPQDTGSGESGRFGAGIGSPGSRSQFSQGSGSEWGSPPRRKDVLGRASSFADRLITRVGKAKSGFLDNSQGSISGDYLSPMRANTVSSRKASRESQRGASAKEKYGSPTPRAGSPSRIAVPFFRKEDTTRPLPNNQNSSDYLSASLMALPPIPLTPSTPDSSSFFDPNELFDAFPSVPQNLPDGPGTSFLSGFELKPTSDPGLGRGLGKAATISSSYRHTNQSYR